MAKAFDEIVVIYNPNSTGNSEANAKDFAYELQQRIPGLTVTVTATEYAGHAEEIAASYARTRRRILVVSSSGDGGYNEVINGVLGVRSKNTVVTAVLPSGNANDHHNALGSGDLVGKIMRGETEKIEVLQLDAMVGGKSWRRYAHSYIGFGLTPKVGQELTARELNFFNEKWHTLLQMLKFKHVDLTEGGVVRKFNSLVFATVTQMAKIVKLDQNAQKNDGKMEVYEVDYTSPTDLLKMLLRASIQGVSRNDRRKSHELVTIKKTLVQLDGEVFTLDAKTDVVVSCHKDKLRTVL